MDSVWINPPVAITLAGIPEITAGGTAATERRPLFINKRITIFPGFVFCRSAVGMGDICASMPRPRFL